MDLVKRIITALIDHEDKYETPKQIKAMLITHVGPEAMNVKMKDFLELSLEDVLKIAHHYQQQA